MVQYHIEQTLQDKEQNLHRMHERQASDTDQNNQHENSEATDNQQERPANEAIQERKECNSDTTDNQEHFSENLKKSEILTIFHGSSMQKQKQFKETEITQLVIFFFSSPLLK